MTRLFTYVTVDGKIGTAQVISPKAAEVIADKHYDKLADLWTKNDPRSRYWFEDFLGPLLTCSWFPKKFDAYHITDKNSIGKANWERTLCDSLVIDAGLQLLRCDTKDIFERKWSQAVKNGSLEKCLLQSPEQYLGVDYLLGLNHGISATTGPKHSIAKSFLEKLRDIFQHCKGQYSFTLSFFTTGDPTKFAQDRSSEPSWRWRGGETKCLRMCMYRWCRFRRRETAWRKLKRCGVCCRACGVQNKISGMGAWAGMGYGIVFVGRLLRLHSMPCRRSSEARMRMQPPTSIRQKWLWRWFFARRFDGLQKATSLCPEPH